VADVDEGGSPVTTTDSDLYYDPFDFEIDADPYPIWRRMREESPLYYNERYDFYALTRFDDVERGLIEWKTYSSAKGTLLELIKGDFEIPPGSMIFEDPPGHNIHRGLVSRVFTPRKMNAIEPKIREFCARSLDPMMGTDGFDFIADLGAQMPMRTIGMLLGIPEQDQEALREKIDDSLRLDEEPCPTPPTTAPTRRPSKFDDYIDWRAEHPSDDLMTELLQAEFEDETGTIRRLTRPEVLNVVNLLAAAGNETTTRLIGWTGKVLADHPDEAPQAGRGPDTGPKRHRGAPPVRAALPLPGPSCHPGCRALRTGGAEGSAILLLNGSGNRDHRKFPDGDRFDVSRTIDHHLAFGYGLHFCLGAALARLEGRVALDEVLQRFPSWEVDWEHAEQARTSTVRGWERLPVLFTLIRAGPADAGAGRSEVRLRVSMSERG